MNYLIKKTNNLDNIKLIFGNKILKLLRIINREVNKNNITIFTFISFIVFPLRILIKNLFNINDINIISHKSDLKHKFETIIFLELLENIEFNEIKANKIFIITFKDSKEDDFIV